MVRARPEEATGGSKGWLTSAKSATTSCSLRPPEGNDLKGLVEPGQTFLGLCEGCGYGEFDHNGKRIPDGFGFDKPKMEEHV